ncbi:MAG TPA: tRNA preQ1(34) S-adenosylmethionine ribosyltransferase-isomerase QueA [Terriglobales bacterium]|nr:tRNA preQ1(34) S-adenosylmethionine ribosyltransferase-isomerase QueA [Terriglobales bacterium]
MLLYDFDFHLPQELIAQTPPVNRDGAKMLRMYKASSKLDDLEFRHLPELLKTGDLLVFNNTKVFPARLFGCRSGHLSQPVSQKNPAAAGFLKGKVEVLLTRQLSEFEWLALVHPGRKIGIGEKLFFSAIGDGPAVLEAEVIDRGTFGERTLRFRPVPDFFAVVEKIGHIPLPPYINRQDSASDRERYQTVFAKDRGSVAAPTAGLHFTPEILDTISRRGIETAAITLHVGLGTFQPLRKETVEENRLHREAFDISTQAAEQINRAKAEGRRVIAVGTTTTRTLEFAAQSSGGKITASQGDADIFIYPGFRFQVIDALLTNFHLPRSSLLMLVSAFAGGENVLRAYEHAVKERYRFFSYGDCMFVE